MERSVANRRFDGGQGPDRKALVYFLKVNVCHTRGGLCTQNDYAPFTAFAVHGISLISFVNIFWPFDGLRAAIVSVFEP